MYETEKIMKDEKLMKQLRDAREKGSTSSPYEPLSVDCDHRWILEEDFRKNTEFEEEVIRIPCECSKCGDKADEIWIFSCYADKETGEAI